MFFELPWVGVAMDAMTVAIYIKYSVCQNAHLTTYLLQSIITFSFIFAVLVV